MFPPSSFLVSTPNPVSQSVGREGPYPRLSTQFSKLPDIETLFQLIIWFSPFGFSRFFVPWLGIFFFSFWKHLFVELLSNLFLFGKLQPLSFLRLRLKSHRNATLLKTFHSIFTTPDYFEKALSLVRALTHKSI